MGCLGYIICPNPIPIDKIPFSTACRNTPSLSMNDALAYLGRKQIIRLCGEIKKKERGKEEESERGMEKERKQ